MRLFNSNNKDDSPNFFQRNLDSFSFIKTETSMPDVLPTNIKWNDGPKLPLIWKPEKCFLWKKLADLKI